MEHHLPPAFLGCDLLELFGRAMFDVMPRTIRCKTNLFQLVLGVLAPKFSGHEHVRRTPKPGDLLIRFVEQLLLPFDIFDQVGGKIFEFQ